MEGEDEIDQVFIQFSFIVRRMFQSKHLTREPDNHSSMKIKDDELNPRKVISFFKSFSFTYGKNFPSFSSYTFNMMWDSLGK